MADHRQIGICNFCGDCCGVNGETPFVKNWPEAILAWQFAQFNAQFPMAPIVGLMGNPSTGKVEFIGGERFGSTKITGSPASGGGIYYWVWVPGVGFCTDTSPGHDGTTYETKCPYLMGASSPYDGCAIKANSGHNSRYINGLCGQRDLQLVFTDAGKAQWDNDHSNCVLTWEEIIP